MRPLDQKDGSDQARSAKGTPFAPADGAYFTDGKTLFHVERTLTDGRRGELFVELENCGTLELIFCPARSVAALGLRTVKPRAHIA